MLRCSFSFVAAQLLVKMASTLLKSGCCSATSAAELSANCSATSVFSSGMLQGGLEGWGLGLADRCPNWGHQTILTETIGWGHHTILTEAIASKQIKSLDLGFSLLDYESESERKSLESCMFS